MELTLELLEQVFSPVEQIGKKELTVPVKTGTGSLNITLRSLSPEEEADVQRTSARADQSPDGKEAAEIITDAIEYIERFKVAVLSYSIVSVGTTDFRGVKFIDTGEALDNGAKVKIPLHKALRGLIMKWSGPVRTQLFRQYSDLLLQVEKSAEDAILYEPSDIEAELDRAKRRVAKLERDLQEQKKPVELSPLSSQVRSIANGRPEGGVDEVPEEAPLTPEEAPAHVTPPPAPPLEHAAPRAQMRPDIAPPPPPASRPARRDQPQEAPRAEAPVPEEPRMMDSFVSPDNMESAIEAENNRLMDIRRRRAAGLPPAPEAGAMLDVVREQYGHRRAPHVAAAETAAAVGDVDLLGELPDELAMMRGQHPEILGRRTEAPPEAVLVDRPTKDSRNPRFNPRNMP